MKLVKTEQRIELRDKKIFRILTEELEIDKTEVTGEINMCKRRIIDAKKMIEIETEKLRILENIKV